MGDVFRFKKGDRVFCGSEPAEVIDVVPREDSYHVKILTTGREAWIASRLVKPFAKKGKDAPEEDDAFASER
jgi:hypothetical protein